MNLSEIFSTEFKERVPGTNTQWLQNPKGAKFLSHHPSYTQHINTTDIIDETIDSIFT